MGTGGLHLHPMFITIANIDCDIRMKTSSHAWECVAYIPIVDADTFPMHSDFTSILHDRVWHACVDKVVASLKVAAQYGRMMADPRGDLRLAHTLLVGWIADLPEQLMISAVSGACSPSSMATTKGFGDGKVYPPRTGQYTLSKIRALFTNGIDPWDIPRWLNASKAAGLSGVHQPFWRDWPFADPSRFLTPEILHTVHKFFFDHPLNWCKVRVGQPELDARFISMHRRVGFRHFSTGICRVKQLTGREHRDIQRTIVPAIYGAVEPDFVSAMSALIDFFYQAQAPVFTDGSIDDMVRSLELFHSKKQIFLTSGSRAGKRGGMEHFNIPKLGLFPGFAFAIKEMGAIFQYSADVSEKLLGTNAKVPFRSTNHRDFEEQCVRHLDRRDKIRFFHLYTTLKFNGASLQNIISVAKPTVTTLHPASEWLSHVVPGEDRRLGAPRSIRNFFCEQDNIDAQIAHHVTKRPDLPSTTIAAIAVQYQLHDIPAAIGDYLRGVPFDNRLSPRCLEDNDHLPFRFVDLHVWHKFKIQHIASLQPNLILPAQTVKAVPPSISHPWGDCDAVRCELSEEQTKRAC
ncbi:putative zn-finger domain-containing protein [Lyophyllum shimeji]|uniref:Zn-finger domain-containing protein n=1 Tax=Lyophyllum shimeji TaxID=47721 RepID=A0A9P3ULL4_LYOSH|nr:putative zn-finger domain-containing protein [Lyophyllum shimeji]